MKLVSLEEDHVKTQTQREDATEVGRQGCSCKARNTEDTGRPPEAKKRQGRTPCGFQRERDPSDGLDSKLLDSRTVRQ